MLRGVPSIDGKKILVSRLINHQPRHGKIMFTSLCTAPVSSCVEMSLHSRPSQPRFTNCLTVIHSVSAHSCVSRICRIISAIIYSPPPTRDCTLCYESDSMYRGLMAGKICICSVCCCNVRGQCVRVTSVEMRSSWQSEGGGDTFMLWLRMQWMWIDCPPLYALVTAVEFTPKAISRDAHLLRSSAVQLSCFLCVLLVPVVYLHFTMCIHWSKMVCTSRATCFVTIVRRVMYFTQVYAAYSYTDTTQKLLLFAWVWLRACVPDPRWWWGINVY